MKLISSKDTIEFLGQVAPYPWIKRMLQWMIFSEELDPYFSEGKIESWVRVSDYLYQGDLMPAEKASKALDAKIRENFDKEIADKLVGKSYTDTILEHVEEWSKNEDPHIVDSGFFYLCQ